MITADTMVIVNIIMNAVIIADKGIINDSYT